MKVRTTIYMDAAVREKIREIEYQDRQPMSVIIMQAIEEYIGRRSSNADRSLAADQETQDVVVTGDRKPV